MLQRLDALREALIVESQRVGLLRLFAQLMLRLPRALAQFLRLLLLLIIQIRVSMISGSSIGQYMSAYVHHRALQHRVLRFEFRVGGPDALESLL